MDGPAPLASVPSPAALCEVRLNGFPEAVAEVRRRVPDAAPTGYSDARFVDKPAHAMLNIAVWPRGATPPLNPRSSSAEPEKGATWQTPTRGRAPTGRTRCK